MADKLKCVEIVRELCPELRIKRIYAVYDHAEHFFLEGLPSSFALKANNGSGLNLLVLDKSAVVEEQLRKTIQSWLPLNYYHASQEPCYRGIRTKVFAEELAVDANQSFPLEFRLFCFDGKVQFLAYDFLPHDLNGTVYVDREWNLLGLKYKHQSGLPSIPRPARLEEALAIAEKLASGLDFVRIDLYDLERGLVFSEMTSYPWGGFARFKPEGGDEFLGSFWERYDVRGDEQP